MKKFYLFQILMLFAAFATLSSCEEKHETPEEPPKEIFTFEVSDLTPTTFSVNVVPEDKTIGYHCGIWWSEDVYNKYKEGADIQTYLDDTIASQMDVSDKSRAEIIQMMTKTGNVEFAESYCTPSTTIYLFAVGFDSEGKATTECFLKPIVFPAVNGDAPAITKLEVMAGDANGENQATKATARVSATNVKYGRYVFFDTEQLNWFLEDGFTYEQILYMKSELTAKEISDMTSKEFVSTIIGEPNMGLTFILQVISEGGHSTLVHKDCVLDAEAPFKINLSGISPTTVSIEVTPVDKTMPYMCSYLTPEEFAKYGSKEQIQAYVTEHISKTQELNPEATIEQIVTDIASVGDVEGMFILPSDATYHFFAVGIANDGTITSDPVFAEAVLPAVFGDAPAMNRFEVTAGDADGNNTSSQVTAWINSPDVLYGSYCLTSTAEAEMYLSWGMTYENLVDMMGSEFKSTAIAEMNAGDFPLSGIGLSSNTSYTFILKLVSKGGVTGIYNASGSTLAATGTSSLNIASGRGTYGKASLQINAIKKDNTTSRLPNQQRGYREWIR